MRIYDRYMSGETRTVYEDIYKLGEDAFLPCHLTDIEKVLEETFDRVASNLQIIYRELKEVGYSFRKAPVHNFERPLHPPLPDTNWLLDKLDGSTLPFGYVPLSLKIFYSIVGGVNFAWDYETEQQILWAMADPIQIISLDAIVEEVTHSDWREIMEEHLEEEAGCPYVEFSADVFHKDNVSGGPAYAIQLTSQRSIDSLLMNEPHNTTFIDYLRVCFEHCGFLGSANTNDNNFRSFMTTVRPQLQKI